MTRQTVASIAILVGAIVIFAVSIIPLTHFGMDQSIAQASTGLPSDVTRFDDGSTTCYVLEESWLKFGGISCLSKTQ